MFSEQAVNDLVVPRSTRATRTYLVSKRVLDLAAACVGLLVLSPVLAVLAILIRRDSEGPALFRQTRIGRYGKPFTCYKFRTMYQNADEQTHRAYIEAYSKGQVVRFPVAHHDGNYFADADTLARIEDTGMVAFRYVTPDGIIDASGNPNGSANSIAGLFNESRTVLGLMPHPERAFEPLHGNTDGRAMFTGLVEALS